MAAVIKKAFLQACINHGAMTANETNLVLESLCEAHDTAISDVKELVKEINTDLHEYDQSLSFIKHPLLGQEFLVFSFSYESAVSKRQLHYTESDRLYFARLLDIIVNQENFGISWLQAYDLPSDMASLQKQLPKSRMQDLVQRWTDQGYFIEKDEFLYFGPRTLVEYANYLKTKYPDSIKDCPLCTKLVLWDVKCSDCNTRIHRDCIRKYLIRNSTCPSCSHTWNTRLSQ